MNSRQIDKSPKTFVLAFKTGDFHIFLMAK
jgi:hypothetical protein